MKYATLVLVVVVCSVMVVEAGMKHRPPGYGYLQWVNLPQADAQAYLEQELSNIVKDYPADALYSRAVQFKHASIMFYDTSDLIPPTGKELRDEQGRLPDDYFRIDTIQTVGGSSLQTQISIAAYVEPAIAQRCLKKAALFVGLQFLSSAEIGSIVKNRGTNEEEKLLEALNVLMTSSKDSYPIGSPGQRCFQLGSVFLLSLNNFQKPVSLIDWAWNLALKDTYFQLSPSRDDVGILLPLHQGRKLGFESKLGLKTWVIDSYPSHTVRENQPYYVREAASHGSQEWNAFRKRGRDPFQRLERW